MAAVYRPASWQDSKAHEEADFDLVLVGYYSSSAEGFAVASYAASCTTRLSFLIAHRPGLVAPTLAARTIATFDALWGGRLAVHIIAGNSDDDMQRDGDFTPKDERYERAAEYLAIMRRVWTCTEPFDFDGRFYRLRKVFPEVRPVQRPYPELLFGGSSPGALIMGAQHCDTFAMFGEPLAETAERIEAFRDMTRGFGRPAPKFNVSFRPILGRTEGEAWDRAHRILANLKAAPSHPRGQDQSGKRLVELATKADILDERLWMPVAALSGGKGNTSCLVGTAEQVADAMLKYYRLGVTSFLMRGFDPFDDAREYGRELIPRLRAGALSIDQESELAA